MKDMFLVKIKGFNERMFPCQGIKSIYIKVQLSPARASIVPFMHPRPQLFEGGINLYPVDNTICFAVTYLLDSNIFIG